MRSLRTEEVALLIKKKLEGVITAEESSLLQEWADSEEANRCFLDNVLADDSVFKESLRFVELEKSDKYSWEKRLTDLTFQRIKASKKNQPITHYRLRRFIPYVAAAILLVFLGINYLDRKSTRL